MDTLAGNDANSGSSPDAAVKTFEHAKELLASGGSIVLKAPIVVEGKARLSLEGKGDARVVRGESQAGPMVRLEGNASLTLEHITFDGALAGKNVDPIIEAPDAGCELTLNVGAVLQNNTVSSGTFGSAVAGWKGLRLVMNDGAAIRGNSTTSAGYGTVMLANGSTFTMNGGAITGNRANRGGGVALMASSMVMNGGSIEGNSAYAVLTDPPGDGYGGGVYLSSFEEMSGLPGSPNSIVAGNAALTMNGGSIDGNSAESQGGGVLAFPMAEIGDIKLEINGGSIDNNVAQRGHGGGIALYDLNAEPVVTLKMGGGSVSGNRSPVYGGGVYLYCVGGEQAQMSGGRIEGNTAANGGGVMVQGGSVWNMSGGSIAGSEARAGGGVMLHPDRGRDVLKMTSGSIAGNNAKNDQAKTKGDGVYQGGLFEISGDARVGADNDVYLPSKRIIDVVAPFTGAATARPVSITSKDHVMEPVGAATPGTRLVRYHAAAGGVDRAMDAQRNQIFVPSAKMLKIDPTFYIGKSMGAEQLEYMTYIKKPAAHLVSYRFEGEVPQGAQALLPAGSEHVEGEFVCIADAPTLEGYRFTGWKSVQALEVADGAFVMPGEDVLLVGTWERLPEPPAPPVKPDPAPETGDGSIPDKEEGDQLPPPVPDPEPEKAPAPGDHGNQDQGAPQTGHEVPEDDRDRLPNMGDAPRVAVAAAGTAGLLALCASRRVRRESHV